MDAERARRLYPWANDQQISSLASMQPYQKALLDTIAGPESAGKYNVMYGGKTFSDFSQHPGVANPIQSGPNAGKTSSAAGKYQFIKPTWNEYQQKLGLPDFSPGSQDVAAWALAKDTYARQTGGNLDQALQSGDPNTIAGIGQALKNTWTSLPGGIEQGTSTSRFVNTYNQYLGNPAQTAQAVSPGLSGTQAIPQQMPVAEDDGLGLAGIIAQIAATQQPTAPPVAPMAQAPQQDIDPQMETMLTSQTPNVYRKRRIV